MGLLDILGSRPSRKQRENDSIRSASQRGDFELAEHLIILGKGSLSESERLEIRAQSFDTVARQTADPERRRKISAKAAAARAQATRLRRH